MQCNQDSFVVHGSLFPLRIPDPKQVEHEKGHKRDSDLSMIRMTLNLKQRGKQKRKVKIIKLTLSTTNGFSLCGLRNIDIMRLFVQKLNKQLQGAPVLMTRPVSKVEAWRSKRTPA